MGNYLFSNIEEPAVGSYCINSYSDCNLIIERIEKNNDDEIIIHYKVIE